MLLELTEAETDRAREWAQTAANAVGTPAGLLAAAEGSRVPGLLLSPGGLGSAVLALTAIASQRTELATIVLGDVVVRAVVESAEGDRHRSAPLSFGLGADGDPRGLRLNGDGCTGTGVWLARHAPEGVLLADTAEGGLALVEAPAQDPGGGLVAPGPAGALLAGPLGPRESETVRAVVRVAVAAVTVGLVDGLVPAVAGAVAGVDVSADRWNGQGARHRLADIALDRDAAWLHLFDAVEDPGDARRMQRCSALAALAALAAARNCVDDAAAAARAAGDPDGLAAAEIVRSTTSSMGFAVGGVDRLLGIVASAVVNT